MMDIRLNNKNNLFKPFLYGCLVYISCWVLFLIIFTILTNINFIPSLFEKVSLKLTFIQILSSFLVMTLLFGIMGVLISQTYGSIKNRIKKMSVISLGGNIMLIVALFFLIFNQLFMRLIIGRKLEFFPIENRIIREILFIALAYGFGAFIGFIYKKLRP